MSDVRREKEKLVKKKISEILISVREEKQHIENQLARNDLLIQQYCQQYEKLRNQTDLTQLSQNETIILQSIIEGLQQAHVDPMQILGQQTSQLFKKQNQFNEEMFSQLPEPDVVKVQETIIHNLLEQIEQAEHNKNSKSL